jgi:hypothetical protein
VLKEETGGGISKSYGANTRNSEKINLVKNIKKRLIAMPSVFIYKTDKYYKIVPYKLVKTGPEIADKPVFFLKLNDTEQMGTSIINAVSESCREILPPHTREELTNRLRGYTRKVLKEKSWKFIESCPNCTLYKEGQNLKIYKGKKDEDGIGIVHDKGSLKIISDWEKNIDEVVKIVLGMLSSETT